MEFIEDTDKLELKRCWSLLKSRWKLILLAALSGAGLSALLLNQQPLTYAATGRLLIRSEQTSTLTGLDVDLGELRSLGSYQKDPLDTQLAILQSAPVIQRVIRQLDLRDALDQPLTTPAFLKQLNTEVVRGTDVLQVSFESEDGAIAAAVVNELVQAYIDNNVRVNRQEAISARVFIEQQLPASEQAVSQAESALSQFKNKHRIITLEEESTQAIAVIADLDRQREEAQTQLADVQAQVDKLRRQIGMDAAEALDASVLSESASVQDTLAQIQAVESELIAERAQYQRGTPVVSKLETQAIDLQRLLNLRVDQALENTVKVKVPVSRLQVGPTQQELIATFLRLEIEADGLKNRIQSLTQIANEYKNRALMLPSLEQEQRELNRQLTAAQTTYENLLDKLEEVNAAEKQNVENARVIELPSEGEAVASVQGPVAIAAGGLLGGLLGVSAVFLLAALDKPVRTIQRAKESLNYDLLGIIPAFDGRGHLRDDFYRAKAIRLLERDLSSSTIQGSYRSVLEHVVVGAKKRHTKTLLLTSATAGEGKSEVAVNLAVSLSQLGQKVLLVDANPQAPGLHRVWQRSNHTGLTTLLQGEGRVEHEIQPITSDLHLLTAGPSIAKTAALFRSWQMQALLERLSRHYDYILFDGPALSAAEQGHVLTELCGGLVFVIRPGDADLDSVMGAKQGLQHVQAKILGMVVNGVDIRVEPSHQLQLSPAQTAPVLGDRLSLDFRAEAGKR